jgi:hypothetical protein
MTPLPPLFLAILLLMVARYLTLVETLILSRHGAVRDWLELTRLGRRCPIGALMSSVRKSIGKINQ